MPIDGHGVRPTLSIGPQVSGDGVKALGVGAVVPTIPDNLRRLGGQLVATAPSVLLVVHVVVLVTVGEHTIGC